MCEIMWPVSSVGECQCDVHNSGVTSMCGAPAEYRIRLTSAIGTSQYYFVCKRHADAWGRACGENLPPAGFSVEWSPV